MTQGEQCDHVLVDGLWREAAVFQHGERGGEVAFLVERGEAEELVSAGVVWVCCGESVPEGARLFGAPLLTQGARVLLDQRLKPGEGSDLFDLSFDNEEEEEQIVERSAVELGEGRRG